MVACWSNVDVDRIPVKQPRDLSVQAAHSQSDQSLLAEDASIHDPVMSFCVRIGWDGWIRID